VEKNGRNWGSPWSLRQTAVYQRFDIKSKKSAWILMQPSTHIRDWLENNLSGIDKLDESFMLLHLLFLSSMEENWTDYLDDLILQVNALVGRIQPSNIL
jgi:hypothetical protein